MDFFMYARSFMVWNGSLILILEVENEVKFLRMNVGSLLCDLFKKTRNSEHYLMCLNLTTCLDLHIPFKSHIGKGQMQNTY